MAGDFLVRWADWSGGNFGTLDPAFAEKNQYSGQNVSRYNSGLIGPRAGLKQLEIEWGVGQGEHLTVPGPYGFDVCRDEIIMVMGDETFRIPFTDVQPITPGIYDAYDAPVASFVRFAQHSGTLYGLIDGDLWKHEDDGTTTQITLPIGVTLSNLVRWGYYLVGVDALTPWRIWHSEVTIAGADPDEWGDNAYLDVGSNLPITSMKPIYNTLWCGKEDGWFGVSGTLGELAAVRQRTIANGPTDDRGVTVTTDGRILYWPKDSTPAWFNGDRTYLDKDYELTGFETQFECDTVAATPTGQRLIMIGERTDQPLDEVPTSGMLLWDKEWSTHTFGIPIGGIACGDVRNGVDLPEGVMFMIQRPVTVGDPVSIVSFQTDPNRPAHVDDAWAAPMDYVPGDDLEDEATELVTASLDLPAHWDGQGRFLRVTSVIVQFRKWPSGIEGSRNMIQTTTVPLGLYDGGTQNSEIKLWTEPSELADPAGTDDSMRIDAGDMPWSQGFQIQFPVIRGVAIREVIAVVEVRTQRT